MSFCIFDAISGFFKWLQLQIKSVSYCVQNLHHHKVEYLLLNGFRVALHLFQNHAHSWIS